MNDYKNKTEKVLRWTARIFSILIVSFLWFMLSAHYFGSGEDPPGGFMTTFFLILPIGLIIAWKWELYGSIIVFISLIIFHTSMFLKGNFSFIPFIDIAAIPGILFFISWYRKKGKETTASITEPENKVLEQ